MEDWIAYEEGEYDVAQAFLRVPCGRGLRTQKTVVEIYRDAEGRLQLKGYGQLVNALLMDLMDDGEDVDLVLDFSEGHRYCLAAPILRAGKLFTPGVRSAFHFYPSGPWRPLSDPHFEALVAETTFLDEPETVSQRS